MAVVVVGPGPGALLLLVALCSGPSSSSVCPFLSLSCCPPLVVSGRSAPFSPSFCPRLPPAPSRAASRLPPASAGPLPLLRHAQGPPVAPPARPSFRRPLRLPAPAAPSLFPLRCVVAWFCLFVLLVSPLTRFVSQGSTVGAPCHDNCMAWRICALPPWCSVTGTRAQVAANQPTLSTPVLADFPFFWTSAIESNRESIGTT